MNEDWESVGSDESDVGSSLPQEVVKNKAVASSTLDNKVKGFIFLIFDGFANDEANITFFFHSTKWQVPFLFARLCFDAQLVFVLAKVVL